MYKLHVSSQAKQTYYDIMKIVNDCILYYDFTNANVIHQTYMSNDEDLNKYLKTIHIKKMISNNHCVPKIRKYLSHYAFSMGARLQWIQLDSVGKQLSQYKTNKRCIMLPVLHFNSQTKHTYITKKRSLQNDNLNNRILSMHLIQLGLSSQDACGWLQNDLVFDTQIRKCLINKSSLYNLNEVIRTESAQEKIKYIDIISTRYYWYNFQKFLQSGLINKKFKKEYCRYCKTYVCIRK